MNEYRITISTAKEAADYAKKKAREDLRDNLFVIFFGVIGLIAMWWLMGEQIWVN